MKKRKLKKWVKISILLIGGLIFIAFGCKILRYQDDFEKNKAYAEGRFEKCYTKTGDVYYK